MSTSHFDRELQKLESLTTPSEVAKRERAGKWFPRVQARVGKSGSKDGSRLALFSPGVSSYVLAACWLVAWVPFVFLVFRPCLCIG